MCLSILKTFNQDLLVEMLENAHYFERRTSYYTLHIFCIVMPSVFIKSVCFSKRWRYRGYFPLLRERGT